jgi:hypothetical protein
MQPGVARIHDSILFKLKEFERWIALANSTWECSQKWEGWYMAGHDFVGKSLTTDCLGQINKGMQPEVGRIHDSLLFRLKSLNDGLPIVHGHSQDCEE